MTGRKGDGRKAVGAGGRGGLGVHDLAVGCIVVDGAAVPGLQQ